MGAEAKWSKALHLRENEQKPKDPKIDLSLGN